MWGRVIGAARRVLVPVRASCGATLARAAGAPAGGRAASSMGPPTMLPDNLAPKSSVITFDRRMGRRAALRADAQQMALMNKKLLGTLRAARKAAGGATGWWQYMETRARHAAVVKLLEPLGGVEE